MTVLYEYRCRTCNHVYELITHMPSILCNCGQRAKRVFSFSARMSMPDHYNNATGQYARNERHLKDQFKEMSDIATARNGVPHNFVPIDPHDKETLGITDEGLDSTYDANVKSGKIEPTRKLR